MEITYSPIHGELKRRRAGTFLFSHLTGISPRCTGTEQSHKEHVLALQQAPYHYKNAASWAIPVQLQAEDSNGDLVGALQMFPNPTMLHYFAGTQQRALGRKLTMISHMAVVSTHRGKGIGSELIALALKEARKRHFEFVGGFAEGDLLVLRAFYSTNGFLLQPPGEQLPEEILGPPRDSMLTDPRRQGIYFWTRL